MTAEQLSELFLVLLRYACAFCENRSLVVNIKKLVLSLKDVKLASLGQSVENVAVIVNEKGTRLVCQSMIPLLEYFVTMCKPILISDSTIAVDSVFLAKLVPNGTSHLYSSLTQVNRYSL